MTPVFKRNVIFNTSPNAVTHPSLTVLHGMTHQTSLHSLLICHDTSSYPTRFFIKWVAQTKYHSNLVYYSEQHVFHSLKIYTNYFLFSFPSLFFSFFPSSSCHLSIWICLIVTKWILQFFHHDHPIKKIKTKNIKIKICLISYQILCSSSSSTNSPTPNPSLAPSPSPNASPLSSL